MLFRLNKQAQSGLKMNIGSRAYIICATTNVCQTRIYPSFSAYRPLSCKNVKLVMHTMYALPLMLASQWFVSVFWHKDLDHIKKKNWCLLCIILYEKFLGLAEIYIYALSLKLRRKVKINKLRPTMQIWKIVVEL